MGNAAFLSLKPPPGHEHDNQTPMFLTHPLLNGKEEVAGEAGPVFRH